MREGALYAGAIAVDNVVTTLWMIATLVLPAVLIGSLGTGLGTFLGFWWRRTCGWRTN